jgi:hypothetical protein
MSHDSYKIQIKDFQGSGFPSWGEADQRSAGGSPSVRQFQHLVLLPLQPDHGSTNQGDTQLRRASWRDGSSLSPCSAWAFCESRVYRDGLVRGNLGIVRPSGSEGKEVCHQNIAPDDRLAEDSHLAGDAPPPRRGVMDVTIVASSYPLPKKERCMLRSNRSGI